MTSETWDDEDVFEDGPLNGDPDDDTEPDDEDLEATSLALWEGDQGGLTLAQRRAFLALLKHRFITAEKQPVEWRAVLESTDLIRGRLNDLFLELHLDTHRQVAFKRQAAPEVSGKSFPTLLHNTAYSREETILLAYLRMKFRSDAASGQVFVDREELLEYVAGFRPDSATDESLDTRKTLNAIENIRKTGVLVAKAEGERFLVSPVIEVLITKEKFEELLDWLVAETGELEDEDTSAVEKQAVLEVDA